MMQEAWFIYDLLLRVDIRCRDYIIVRPDHAQAWGQNGDTKPEYPVSERMGGSRVWGNDFVDAVECARLKRCAPAGHGFYSANSLYFGAFFFTIFFKREAWQKNYNRNVGSDFGHCFV